MKKVKTLANCTPREMVVQINKISARIKKYKDGISKIEKIKKLAVDGTPILDDNGNPVETADIFGIIDYICDSNIDETMALCGELCFMSGEEFGNLYIEEEIDGKIVVTDGFEILTSLLNCKRLMTFFTSSVKMKAIYRELL